MEKTFLTSSHQETQEVAQNLISKLSAGTTICLLGELASGKTTFTQGVGLALGISRVTSPTYMIMREYKVESHPNIKRLFHLDLYRLNSVEEIKAFDLAEIWSDPKNLIVVEWPEKILEILPNSHYLIYFKQTGPSQREISIIKNNTKS
ncbi:tRNA (adenosine(37)-N6)-threonylcarbamoyltransferase complex ATPase subunit type 1 TsaE [Candidatus Collierbacteria bacterium RIFOXYD1_FULL_40_9]|uniref:tRNA threonylcarbamoyladenosine biosynthesis protein TsaE n=1 Tax=Candidatus Collierbacteria bacterium RIFOXYD1_FULL_40_9 TaxID=1817731 RepID=A0A1F5FUK9_9BACT|nr:MAG: tRNA (adenosine(37)-N6)-threonylcarbamoyltransferase complex ATPase subunit type 1 TsaE [Candidatus Collierbacteria bacterium RIFOXYD1_FULL_40_9]